MSDNRRFFKGSCHCGYVRYLLRITPTTEDHPPGQRIYRCNCTSCHKMGHFHLRPSVVPEDFVLLSPVDPLESLGDYQWNDFELHFLFCKTCGVRPFILCGEGETADVDVEQYGVDGLKNPEGQSTTKIWRVKAASERKYLSVNGVTVDAGQEGFELRDYVERKTLSYLDWLQDEDKETTERPHPGAGFDVETRDQLQNLEETDDTSLLLAVADRDVPKLRGLIALCASGSLDINNWHPEFGSALELAVTLDDVTAVDILLAGGASPWTSSGFANPISSPILAASETGNSFMFRRLCKYAEVEDDDKPASPYDDLLLNAAMGGHAGIVEDILSRCPQWPDHVLNSLLLRATEGWHSEIVRLVLDKFDYSSCHLDDALAYAICLSLGLLDAPPRVVRGTAFLQQQEVLELLFDAGADVKSCKNPVIETAATANLVFALKTLLEHGADANERGPDMQTTALHLLGRPVRVAPGPKRTLHEMGIRILLDHGADVLARDTAGNTPLHYAAFGANVRVLRLLISKIPVTASMSIINLENDAGETLLHWAAAGKNYEIVSYLLLEGAKVNSVNKKGWTPLLCAIVPKPATEISGPGYKPHIVVETANLLLEHGADALVSSAEGWTPLHLVAAHLDTGESDLMAELAADLIARGSPIAQRAAIQPPFEFSIYGGPEFDNVHVGIWGSRAATYASEGGDPDVELQDATPLHWAAYYGAVGTASALTTYGADVHAKNSRGHFPGHLAVESRRLNTSHPRADKRLLQLLATDGIYTKLD